MQKPAGTTPRTVRKYGGAWSRRRGRSVGGVRSRATVTVPLAAAACNCAAVGWGEQEVLGSSPVADEALESGMAELDRSQPFALHGQRRQRTAQRSGALKRHNAPLGASPPQLW